MSSVVGYHSCEGDKRILSNVAEIVWPGLLVLLRMYQRLITLDRIVLELVLLLFFGLGAAF